LFIEKYWVFVEKLRNADLNCHKHYRLVITCLVFLIEDRGKGGIKRGLRAFMVDIHVET